MHINTKIRNQIFQMMNESPDFKNIRIYNSRINDISEPFPAISIYTIDDKGEKTADELTLVKNIDVYTALYEEGKDAFDLFESKDEKSVDEKLDDLREKVENLFLKPYQTLNKTIYRLNYVETKQQRFTESEKTQMTALIKWVAIFNQEIS